MKLKHLFLTFSFVVGIFSVAFAQQQQTALNVATTNPSEPMNFAGNEQACFISKITNNAADNSTIFIDNIQVDLPFGFELDSMLLTQGEAILISNTNSISLNDTLFPSDSCILKYYVHAKCDAVPTNLSNQFSIRHTNTLHIKYIEHNTIKTIEESTNDYTLMIPNLYLSVGSSNSIVNNNIKDIVWREQVYDEFTIKNTEGAGSISTLHISMSPENADAFSNVVFSVGEHPIIPNMENGVYSFDLSTLDFQRAGLGELFDEREQLKVSVSFLPTRFYLQTQVKYSAQVKNDDDICNEQTNASAYRDYHCAEPNVQLRTTMQVTNFANYCGEKFTCDITFANISENVRTNLYRNARINFVNSNYQITSVQYNGEEIVALPNGDYPLPTDDVDEDGSPDLRPHDSCTIHVEAKFSQLSDNVLFWAILYGESVEDRTFTTSCSAQNYFSINPFSLISPSDSKEGDTATYHVDLRLQTQNYFNNRENGFMDVEYIGLMYNDSTVRIFDDQSIITYNNDIDIIASCEKPQLFKVVVKTNECDELYVSDYRNGKSIVECPDSLLDSNCIGIHTINVEQITPQAINTCETFTINALGELLYRCTDTCPTPRRIIARIYDLDENLQFESVACSISVNGSSYTIQPSNGIAISNGIAWITDIISSLPCSETVNHIPLQLTAEVFIKGNHELPNMSNCNIRVEFAVENDESIVLNANSKGSSLTVYDPEPNLSNLDFSSDMCNANVSVTLKTTIAAPSIRSNHPPQIFHVDFPGVEGSFYTTIDEIGMSHSVDPQDATAFNCSDGVIKTSRVQLPISTLCRYQGSSFGNLHGLCIYSDFYASCNENEIDTATVIPVGNLSAPIIEMNSSVEQALTTLTTWNVFVKNVSNIDAPNVTLRLKPNENNVTGLYVNRIYVDGHRVPSVEYPVGSGIHYVYIGLIVKNSNTPVKVSVTMSGCTGEGTSFLDVTAIWSCEDIFTKENIDEEFELRNCNNFFTQLELQNMEAKLVAESLYTNEEYKLCQEIPIHLDVYNSGKAMLTDVGFLLDKKSFSEYVILENNELNTFYNGIEQKIINGIDVMNIIGNLSDTNSIISTQILKYTSEINGLPSRNSDLDVLSIDFSIIVNCGGIDTVSIKPLQYKVSALNNCGELQEKKFLYHLPLEGLDQIQMVGTTASSSQFTTIQSGGIAEGQLTVTVTNNSLDVLRNLIVGVELPDGLTVITASNDSQIHGFSLHSTLTEEGTTEVQLTAPTGYTIPIGESRTFTIVLQENELCPKKSVALVNAGILLDIPSNCSETGTCPAYAFTDSDTVQLERLRQPVVVTVTGVDTVCVGNEVILTASGANTYIWDDNTTNATINVAYPKTTYHVTGFVDECSDTAEHTITFVEHLTQPQLILVVGADTITNGKIQYSDWNTMGEQIIHAISDVGGTLTKISEPNDGKCGIYEYQYTITNQCDSLATSITFEVENCDTTTCEDDDLVVIDGKTGYTLEDLEVLRGYVQNGATLQPASDGGFTITIQTNCGGTTYTLNGCFLDNADINKDGVVNNADIDRLAELILEQTNCQNNHNN